MARIIRFPAKSLKEQVQDARDLASFRDVLAIHTNGWRTPADLSLVVASVRKRFGWRGSIADAEELLIGSGEFQLLNDSTPTSGPLITASPDSAKRAA
jgi:hypothetical protein